MKQENDISGTFTDSVSTKSLYFNPLLWLRKFNRSCLQDTGLINGKLVLDNIIHNPSTCCMHAIY